MKPISIIELPFNLGLRMLNNRKPGVNKLPAWLRQHHFHDLLSPVAVHTLEAPAYTMEADPDQGILNTDLIAGYAIKQAALLQEVIAKGQFPIVIGGDCSIVIGNMLALKKQGRYALFYLDGHTDFMRPVMSGTKAVAGMVAAVVAGIGHQKLINIENQGPYVEEEHVWCVGNREYDETYENEIRASKATYVSLKDWREQGLGTVVCDFLAMVEEKRLDGYWLHIDVDILDDAVMPAVDSRTEGGLSYAEFDQILYWLLMGKGIAGVDITILDPDLDQENQYTAAFIQHFTETFNKKIYTF